MTIIIDISDCLLYHFKLNAINSSNNNARIRPTANEKKSESKKNDISKN